MATRAQFDALGQAIDADITAITAQITTLEQQIADLQAQLAAGSGSMTGQEEDDTFAQFTAIKARTGALVS